MSTTDRDAFTDGLIAVARFLHDHPEVPLPYLGAYAEGSNLPVLPIYLHSGDQKAQLAVIARAMGNVTKAPVSHSNGDERFQVWREFKGVVLMAQASRDQVCTRVVTGTEDREVEEVVMPAVTRKVTKPVELVEWRCQPLLATPASVLTELAMETDPDGVADAVISAIAEHVRYCDSCDVPSSESYLLAVTIAETGERKFYCADNEACGVRRAALHVAPPQADEAANAGA